MDNSVITRFCNNRQKAGDVLEVGLNESDDCKGMLCLCVQVIGRKKVRGQICMPDNWAKYDGDRISVSFNEMDNLLIRKQQANSKKVAEIAKANGSKKKMVQVTAKKSYARVRQELAECLTGNKRTRMEWFRACFLKDT